jgi:hypothetical protein
MQSSVNLLQKILRLLAKKVSDYKRGELLRLSDHTFVLALCGVWRNSGHPGNLPAIGGTARW